MTIEVGSLVQHKCGGPVMYVMKRIGNADDGLQKCRCWNSATGAFQWDMFSPDELVAVSKVEAD